MQHIYVNNTSEHVTVNIIKNGQVLEVFVFPPFSNREFDFPALDNYVPQLLKKKCPITGANLVPVKPELKKEEKLVVAEEPKKDSIEVVVEEVAEEVVEEIIEEHSIVKEVVEDITEESNKVEEVVEESSLVEVTEDKPKRNKKSRK